jgi:hypothetical protein
LPFFQVEQKKMSLFAFQSLSSKAAPDDLDPLHDAEQLEKR